MTTNAYFIAGTDTGVGKTWMSAKLLQAADLKQALYLKPVQTGTAEGDDDSAMVSSLVPGIRTKTLLSFRKPASPLSAAFAEDCSIDPGALLIDSREAMAGSPFSIIEGAGGLLVPIADSWFMADFAAGLGLPLLLVSRAGLGTINHTLLSLEAAFRRQLTVAAVVLNPGPNPPDMELARENQAYLSRVSGVPHFLWEDNETGRDFFRSLVG